MIELRLLGSVGLTGPDGAALGTVVRQPKRLALLAYLAVASPPGFHRRDTLLSLFWPERDDERGRDALNHSLYVLRRELGDGVILSRGDEEVGLAPDRCRCDAVAFEEAVRQGKLEQAAGLYRGDLLAGFHLSDAPEFERWLETARTRLRDRATAAAWALADQSAAAGRLPAAVHWARQAVALSPYDEVGVRRLLALLDRAGDRAGAVHAYEQFTERLAAELELQPSAETAALVEAIRSRQRPGSTRRPVPGPPAGEEADRTGPVPAAGARRAGPPGRRRFTSAGLGLLLIAALGMAGAFGTRLVSAPTDPPSPAAIAVLPFGYRGDPELSYLGEGMATLLSASLGDATGLRSIDPRAILKFTRRNTAPADPEHARSLAERFGAGLFVLGDIVEAGGRLRVSATVYDARGRTRGSAEATAAGSGEILDAADRLARYILAGTQETSIELASVADRITSSLPAFKAYLEGERELWAGRTVAAAEAFERAVQLDTTFALAYYRLGLASRDVDRAAKAAERALHHGSRLGDHHRRLIEALAMLHRGDHRAADQEYRQILAAYPDDAEAWFMLGQLIAFRGHLLPRAWVDAREPYERALSLGPRIAAAAWWLAAIAAREGRRADLDSLTELLLALNQAPDFDGNALGQRAVVMGDTGGVSRFMADLRGRSDLPAQVGAGAVTWTTGDLVIGRRLWRLITEPSRSPGTRVLAHVTLAKIELTNGRLRAASAELDAIEALEPVSALEHRALFALTRFAGAARPALAELRDSLTRRTAPDAGPEGDGLLAMHRPVHAHLRLYLLGSLSARLGDTTAALDHARRLELADTTTAVGAFASDLGRVVRAEVAWTLGHEDEALATLERARFWTTHSSLYRGGDSPFFTHLHERFARAELLYELGRYEEALPWYRALTYDLLYTAPSHFRTAEIHERRGDRKRAVEHYSRFLELWRECDPELQPMVRRAREALSRLR